MGWWNNIWKTRSEDWLFFELDSAQVPGGRISEKVPVNSAYLSIFLKSMRITHVRKGLSKFYGTAHSFISLPHRSITEPAEFNVLTTPGKLKNVDADAIDHVIQMDRRLLGPIPYRGGDLDIEIGLFSIKSADLAEPFLNVLEQLSDLAGVSYVKAAKSFVQPLKNGIALLTGSSGDTLEIGMARTFTEPRTGYFVVMRAPKGPDSNDIVMKVKVDPNDFKLVHPQPETIEEYPYMIIEVQYSSARDDWFRIPELHDVYQLLQSDVREGNYEKVKQSLVVFKRTAIICDDLLQQDSVRLIELVEKEVNAAMPSTATSTTHTPRTLVSLDKLRLF